MKTVPISMSAMLATNQLTLARCVKIVLRDGTELGFTDHDRDLTVALSNDQYEPLTYQSGHGIIVGDLSLALGLDSDNGEMSFPFGDLISRTAVLSRRFNQARCYIFDVNWDHPSPEPLELMAGIIAEARPERHMVVFEIRSQADFWNVTVGRLLSPMCSADFGDEQCGATPVDTLATIETVLSNMRFTIDLTGYADNHWVFGTANFLSGGLAGTWPFEVVDFNGTSREVEVLAPMPATPEVGDLLYMRNGCSRVKEYPDDLTIPTCATHSNWRRFRGFDRVPGSDRYLRPAIPGGGNQ